MALQNEQLIPVNRRMFNAFNAAVGILGVADADILNLTTWAGTNSSTSMEGMIRAKTTAEQYVRLREQIADEMARVAVLSLSDNTALAAANDVATTRAIFTTNDSNLSGSAYPAFFAQY